MRDNPGIMVGAGVTFSPFSRSYVVAVLAEGSKPRPVLAFPWASASTTRTLCPVAAKAVARLMTVVVLPTPPFWLATATTRGRATRSRSRVMVYPVDDQNAGLLIRKTGVSPKPHVPVTGGGLQFLLHRPSLGENGNGALAQKGSRDGQENIEGSQGTGRHDICRCAREILDAHAVNADIDITDMGCGMKKRRFALVPLHHLDAGNPHDRKNQAGQTGTGTEIDEPPARRRHITGNLPAIENVPRPYLVNSSGADQLEARLPFTEYGNIGGEALGCFRRRAKQPAHLVAGHAASRLTWRSRACRAAGVTPGSRAACPSVAGRAADIVSRISADSPPMRA